MPYYEDSISIGEKTMLTIVWKNDDGSVIVHGEKLVKGGSIEAKKVKEAFANDLHRNFADRFPPLPNPEPDDEEMI